jgi:peptidoglycan hydrolase CwlO-like protein
MTPEERLSRTEANVDRLATVVDTLAGSVVAHDGQIEKLLTITEKHGAQIAALNVAIEKQGQQIADQARQWQAYINTLPRQ